MIKFGRGWRVNAQIWRHLHNSSSMVNNGLIMTYIAHYHPVSQETAKYIRDCGDIFQEDHAMAYNRRVCQTFRTPVHQGIFEGQEEYIGYDSSKESGKVEEPQGDYMKKEVTNNYRARFTSGPPQSPNTDDARYKLYHWIKTMFSLISFPAREN